MSVNLVECFRTIFEEQLSACDDLQVKDMRCGATHLLEKRREIQHVDAELKTQKQEFETKQDGLRRRREELKKQEESLKDSLFKFDRFLKENDAKRARGLRKAEVERAVAREKEQELQQLHANIAALLDKKERLQDRVARYKIYWRFLHSVLTTDKKFEDVWQLMARFETLMSTREHLRESESEVERAREVESAELRRFIGERRSDMLRYNNTLSKLQTELEDVLSQSLELEATWNHIQATAAEETLLLGQIRVVTHNLYHMTSRAGPGDDGLRADDTLEQLDRIQRYIQDRLEIIRHLRSGSDATRSDGKD